MTISSPIGTVHEYTFTAADVLLNGARTPTSTPSKEAD